MEAKKTAVVSGVTSGIGEAIVTTLREAGWQVVGLTRQDCDLSDLVAVAATADRLHEELPVIDALIHVAGVYHDEDQVFAHRDLEDYSPAWIAATMNVGVTAFMLLAGRLLPNVTKDGTIIGISKAFTIDGHEGRASGWLPYYTANRALEDFLTGLAEDYKSGPYVYGIAPADTATPAYVRFFPEAAKDAQPPNSISLLVEHLIKGDSPYNSGDIIVVRDKKSAKGYHA